MPSRHFHKPINSGLDRFAEALSQDTPEAPVTVKAAAMRAGLAYDQANAYMQRIRKQLGPQAI